MNEILRTLAPVDRPLALAGLVFRRLFQGPVGDYDRTKWLRAEGARIERDGRDFLVAIEGLEIRCRRNSSDMDTCLQCLIQEQYGPASLNLEALVVVDLGANIGASALYFARNWPKARVIAVEPEEGNCRLLRENTARNAVQVECMRAAIWSSDEGVSMAPGKGPRPEWARSVVSGGSVPGKTMPTLMTEMGVDHIDLLKVDIEGAEAELFSGSLDWLERVGRCAIETHSPEVADMIAERCGQFGLRRLHRFGEITTYGREPSTPPVDSSARPRS